MSFFKKVFFSNEIGLKKPYEGIFRFILGNTRIEPGNCIFIDDNIENIKTAKRLGFRCIHFKGIKELKSELRENMVAVPE